MYSNSNPEYKTGCGAALGYSDVCAAQRTRFAASVRSAAVKDIPGWYLWWPYPTLGERLRPANTSFSGKACGQHHGRIWQLLCSRCCKKLGLKW